MKVERGDTIHGVPAVALKTMLVKRRDRFTTPEAMGDLGLSEPRATDTMLGLAGDGYVDHVGRKGFTDTWETGDAGRRLTATRIGKRFPAREGRRIAEDIVAAARLANEDPTSPVRVTWIALFGSVLEAEDDALVGDVDLMVRTGPRRLPKQELRRLREAQLATAPRSTHESRLLAWPTVVLLRRLARVSAKASLMDESTLSLGVRHRALYAYDPNIEAEVPVTGGIETSEAEEDEIRDAGSRPIPPKPDPRPWPSPPRSRLRTDAADGRRLDGAACLQAQHMWRLGASLAEISAVLSVPGGILHGYLAAQVSRPDGPLHIAKTLRATLAANVSLDAMRVQVAFAAFGKGRYSGVRVMLADDAGSCEGDTTGDGLELRGNMFVERACAAAERWRSATARALGGIAATCELSHAPMQDGAPLERAVPDFSTLRSTCEAWLNRAGPVKGDYGPYRRVMAVSVGGVRGPKVEGLLGDLDPACDAAIVAEAGRLARDVVSTGMIWTFEFTSVPPCGGQAA